MTYMDWATFEKLFHTFQKYAFRLETLPHYIVDYEDEGWEAYKRGDPLPPPSRDNDSWRAMISATRNSSKAISRVHLWPERITPYLRFELEWAYCYNAAAGDDIRLLLSPLPHEIQSLAREDYWLFDDEYVVVMDYDKNGKLIGPREPLRDENVRKYVELMRLVWDKAVPLQDYLRMLRTGELGTHSY